MLKMFVHKLDSGHDFQEAQKELDRIKEESVKKGYKPHIIKIADFGAWKSYQQMKAIRGIIRELYKSGEHSCPEKEITLDDLTSYIKEMVIRIFKHSNVWIKKSETFMMHTELKSMGEYSKKEMMLAIESVLAYVDNCNCNSKKMEEIRVGMERDKIWNKNIDEEEALRKIKKESENVKTN